jgi:hypothetical protein
VFGYCRAEGLSRTLASLAGCDGFAGHPVHLFLDGPKGEGDAPAVAAVQSLGRSLSWPNLTLHLADSNRGLRRSVMAGVSRLVAEHGRVIVVEDDLLLSPAALAYFSAGLEAFAANERVKAVCGYMYGVRPPAGKQRAFFLPFASSWGWATWRRAWEPFAAGERRLEERAADLEFLGRCDGQGIIAAGVMLQAQRQGLIDSWAILWNAYLAETGGLGLFPARTMVLNGGFADAAATHASSQNPINRVLQRMNRGRELARDFTLPEGVEADEVMRRRVAGSWEARLHRLSAHLGYHRRRLARPWATGG